MGSAKSSGGQRRIAVLSLTDGGHRLARVIEDQVQGAASTPCARGLRRTLEELWPVVDGLICIMATGIVVRCLAPLLSDKQRDPAVVVCDEAGRFAVSLLSGHLGGANALAHEVATAIGGQAVITTASDVLGHTGLDLWCRDLGLIVSDRHRLTRAMGKLVNTGRLTVWSEVPLPSLPGDLIPVANAAVADLLVSFRMYNPGSGVVVHPRCLVIGIGCNRGTPAEAIAAAVDQVLERHNLAAASVRGLASIDLKADEEGLLALGRQRNLGIAFFSKDRLNAVGNIQVSAAALRAVGVKGVAEPAALLKSGGRLLVPKVIFPDVTVAVAVDNELYRPEGNPS